MPEEHWTESLTHEKITPEAKTILSKFETPEDAHIGYVELQKSAGRPFKLPESLDKLPDDNVRGEFTSQVGRLFGAVQKDEDLNDINFADGISEGRQPVEPLVNAFKKFAVENKLTKPLIQKLIKFNNQVAGSEELTKYFQEQQEKEKLDVADKTNKVLIEKLGTEDAVKNGSNNVKSMFMKVFETIKGKVGMSSEEFEKMADGLIDSGITQSAPLTMALMEIAKNYTEGKSDITDQTKTETKKTDDLKKTKSVIWKT